MSRSARSLGVGRHASALTVETLLDAVEERGAWRARRAQDHPGDERNASSARALRRLAAWIRSNPADPCVRGMLAVQEGCPDVDLSGLAEGSIRELGGYGFGHGSDVDPAMFLVRLAFVLQDDVDRL